MDKFGRKTPTGEIIILLRGNPEGMCLRAYPHFSPYKSSKVFPVFALEFFIQKCLTELGKAYTILVDSNKIVYRSVEAKGCFSTQFFVELNRGLCVTSN